MNSSIRMPRVIVLILSPVLFAAAVSSCDTTDSEVQYSKPGDVRLELIARSAPLPWSLNNGLAVTSRERACVFDSYEVQIICGSRDFDNPVRLGREGAGPGELGAFGILASGPSGTVAFVDMVNQRVTFFSSAGELASIRLSERITPLGEVDSFSSITGHGIPERSGIPRIGVIALDSTGTTVSEQTIAFDDPSRRPGQVTLSGLASIRGGGYVARLDGAEDDFLASYSDAGALTGTFEIPPWDPGFPTGRDVDEYKDQLTRLFGQPPPDSVVNAYRKRRLSRFPRGTVHRSVQQDSSGRFWVLTSRRNSDSTLLDVYRAREYVGSMPVVGRVLAIQIVDDVLVALTELDRPGALLPSRHLHWYRVVETPASATMDAS